MLRRVGDLIAVRARDKMAHSMGLLFITESIAKVEFLSKWEPTLTCYKLTHSIGSYSLRHRTPLFFLKGSEAGEAAWKQGNDAGERKLIKWRLTDGKMTDGCLTLDLWVVKSQGGAGEERGRREYCAIRCSSCWRGRRVGFGGKPAFEPGRLTVWLENLNFSATKNSAR